MIITNVCFLKFKVVLWFFLNRVENLAGSLLTVTYLQTLLLEVLSFVV